MAYFFMMIYRSALPSVWSSLSKAKDAAVIVELGSYQKAFVSVLQFMSYCITIVVQVVAVVLLLRNLHFLSHLVPHRRPLRLPFRGRRSAVTWLLGRIAGVSLLSQTGGSPDKLVVAKTSILGWL